MKALMVLLISITTINAHAMNCSKRGEGVAETTLSLKSNGDLAVGLWGASRNKYFASYIPVECKNNRVGKKCTFKKISDQSTWKDMPQNLYVEFGTFQNVDAVVLKGQFSQHFSTITFNATDCSEYFRYAQGYLALGR